MIHGGHWLELWPIAAFLLFCAFLLALGPVSRYWARTEMRRIDRKRLKEWERQRNQSQAQKSGQIHRNSKKKMVRP